MVDIYIKGFTMKLILTENQYKLLEAIMNEAPTPMSTKVEEGGFIEVVYLINDVEKTNTLEITKKYGGGKYVEGTNSSGRYIVNIGGSLDKDNNTFTVLKDGNYKEGGTDAGGRVLGPEVVGGSKIIVKNVIQINISDSNKTVVDKISTTLGNETNSKKGQSNKEKEEFEKRSIERRAEKDSEAKEIMKLAYADPNIRKLISYQPSILGGLIKLGKAKGLAHIDALLDKHKGTDEKIKKDFLKNHKYSYEVMSPVRVTYGTKTMNFLAGETYPVRFDGRVFNGSIDIDGKRVEYYIRVNKKSNDNTYSGTVTAKFIERGNNSPDREEERTEKIVVKFKG